MKNIVKISLSVIIAIIGVKLLILGYTAPVQAKRKLQVQMQGQLDAEIATIKENSAEAIKKTQADFQRSINESGASIENDKLPRAQLEPLFDDLKSHLDDNFGKLSDHLDNLVLPDVYTITGTMQYCTGWILLAVACGVFSLGLESKSR